ncbi:MAG: bifunctional metallophosphatase/5'-nucleotidase [Oscillospiraceae bacterium]|nr:bifunctional metallophosphatase/5'-nucleotidase [Oscillospiraceae bacterium]
MRTKVFKKRGNSRYLLTVVLITAFVFALFAGFAGCAGQETPISGEVVILHTNDMHGRVINDDDGVIGIDRVAAIHKNIPNSVLVDAGDAFHGLPAATLSRGEDIAGLMNIAGYDAMAAGNHEFNYGWERLLELNDMTDFSILASNVKKDGSPVLYDTALVEAGNIKIGFFGITTESAKSSAMPEYVNGLEFENAVAAAREMARNVHNQGADLIVALCHLGNESVAGTTSAALAQEVGEIDVIIDGHSHTALPEGLIENDVLIVQAGQHGSHIGKVTVTVEDGAVKNKTAELIDFEQAMETEPDMETQAKLAEITNKLDAILSESAGVSNEAMSGERAPGVRTQEMPLGNFVADAYREAAKTDIAITNGGDIRADIDPGTITRGDIISILPFGNTLMIKTITPEILFKVLENGVSSVVTGDGSSDGGIIDHEKSEDGRFLQVSGLSFEYNPAAPAGNRVMSVTLDSGEKLSSEDKTTKITLTASNYIMTGGNDYIMLAELPADREFGTADGALFEYIKTHSPVNAPSVGRITESADELKNAA